MAKNLIFVSCGQLTEQEKTLGKLVKSVIDAAFGFEAYFAESVQDLDALGRNVFDALRRCAGAVIILHDRGLVMRPDGNVWGQRSSVWINQELAILAYRRFEEARKIPVIAFADPKVKLEGAMTSLIVNPRPLNSPPDVETAVREWLTSNHFVAVSDEAFRCKWEPLRARSSPLCLTKGALPLRRPWSAVRWCAFSKQIPIRQEKQYATRSSTS